MQYPFHLPHEAFAERYATSPSEFDLGQLAPEDVPPLYHGHVVTRNTGATSSPIGLYSDGIPQSKHDTFLCYYWSNAVS
eukprot:8564308-Pyramimonas_sp.AAC.1